MNSNSGKRPKRTLLDLFAELDDEGDLDQSFIRSTLKSAKLRDNDLPELLRAAAIPRVVTAEIIGVLRNQSDDKEGNARYLSLISDFPFVLNHPNTGIVYHDNTRDAFLDDWKTTEESSSLFSQINLNLAVHYENRYAESIRADRKLNSIVRLVAQANPARLSRLNALVEAEMTSNLLEATYHRLLGNPADGIQFFRDSFYILEGTSHLTVCRSLISACQDFFQRMPDSDRDPTLLAVVEYFDARITPRIPPYDLLKAETKLKGLLDEDLLPPDLSLWALADLATVYESRMNLAESLSVRLEIEARKHTDVFNSPLQSMNLGSLFWWLNDRENATKQFLRAIKDSDTLPQARQDIGVIARIHLSAVYSELADWDEAFEVGIDAIYKARTEFPADIVLKQLATSNMARLLSTYDPTASDFAAQESAGYPDAGSEERAYMILSYVEVLRSADRTNTAKAIFDRVAQEYSRSDADSLIAYEMDFHRSYLDDLQGNTDAAVAGYSALIESGRNRLPLRRLVLPAIGNRAITYMTLGDISTCLAELEIAQLEWERSGCTVQAAGMKLDMALAEIQQAEFDRAAALLDQADRAIPSDSLGHRLLLVQRRGDLAKRLGEWAQAQEHYQSAYDAAEGLRYRSSQLTLLSELAGVHQELADWSAANGCLLAAENLSLALKAADSPAQLEQFKRAAEVNAEAMCRLGTDQDQQISVDQARQMVRESIELVPDNCWTWWNLAIVCEAQGDWQDAKEAMEKVLSLAPRPMRTVTMHCHLRDTTINRANDLRGRGDYTAARDTLMTVIDELDVALSAGELSEFRTLLFGLLAITGDQAAAAAYEPALNACAVDEPSEAAPFVLAMRLADLLDDVNDYWAAISSLRGIELDPQATDHLRWSAAASISALRPRLEEILGSLSPQLDDDFPYFRSLIVEVGTDLIPLVDPGQDRGKLFHETIPRMREWIRTSTGVSIPGMHVRVEYGLGHDEFSVKIDEFPVYYGQIDPHGQFGFRPVGEPRTESVFLLTDWSPLTGQAGHWLTFQGPAEHTAGAQDLSPEMYLLHEIDIAIRPHLNRFVDFDSVCGLMDDLESSRADLVEAVVPDNVARVRLAWILGSLVEDGLSILDTEDLLAAIQAEGGLGTDSKDLSAAIRRRFLGNGHPRSRDAVQVDIPDHLESALLTPRYGAVQQVADVALGEFESWLAEQRTIHDVFTVVTRAEDTRILIRQIVRSASPLIDTLTRDEAAWLDQQDQSKDSQPVRLTPAKEREGVGLR